MHVPRHRFLSRSLAPLPFLLAIHATRNSVAQPDPPTIRAKSNIAVANVIVTDRKSGEAITGLTQDDLRLSLKYAVTPTGQDFSAPSPRQILYFDHGPEAPLRSLTVWLVTECVMAKRDKGEDSGFLRGRTATLASGLQSLSSDDTVGVAHWCADGNSYIDLKPGHDLDAAAQQVGANLESTYGPGPRFSDKGRKQGLQSLVRLLDYDTIESGRGSRPILLFLDQGTITEDAFSGSSDLNQLLSSSAVCFVLNDGRSLKSKRNGFTGTTRPISGPQLYLDAYWTGGRQIIVQHGDYSSAVRQVLATLHARYDLAFLPLRGGFYYIDVSLTKGAKQRFPDADLQYRRGLWTSVVVAGEPPASR